MAKNRFNWQLIVVVLIGLIVLAASAFGVRRWQRTHRASEGLRLGNLAYEEGRWQEAASQLGRHLSVTPDDVEVLLKYAEAQLKIRPMKQANVSQAVQAYRNALQADKSNAEAAEKLAQLRLNMNAAGEARLIAERSLEAADNVEVRKVLVRALIRQREFAAAADELKRILENDPGAVDAYEMMAGVIVKKADVSEYTPTYWLDEAVTKNATSAEAYIARSSFLLNLSRQGKLLADIAQTEKQNQAVINAVVRLVGYGQDKRQADAGVVDELSPEHIEQLQRLVEDWEKQGTADLAQAQELDLTENQLKLRLADQLMTLGQMDAAGQLLNEVKTTDAAAPGLWRALVALAQQSGTSEEATRTNVIKIVEEALAELPSTERWDFLPESIELLMDCDELERADQCVEEIRARDVMHAPVALWKGLIARERADHQEAITQLSKAAQLGNKSVRLRLNLAEVLARSGDTLTALQYLRSIVAERPNDPGARLSLVRMLSEVQRYAEAEEHAQMALELAPTSQKAAALLLRVQMQLLSLRGTAPDDAKWEQLAQRLADIRKAGDDDVELLMLQFRLAQQRERFGEAEELLNQLREIEPSRPALAVAEAELLIAQDKREQALAKLRETATASADSAPVISLLAKLHNSQGDREASETLLKDALKRLTVNADRRDLAMLLTNMYVEWERPEDAEQLLVQMASEMPDDIPIRRHLLVFPDVLNDPVQAQGIVDEIKEIEGESGWRWRFEQAKVWLISESPSDRTQAVSLLKENLANNPADLASTMLLASSYERDGELRLAAATCREALGHAPDNVSIMIATIKVLNRIGEYEEADEILSRMPEQRMPHPERTDLEVLSHMRREEYGQAEGILRSQTIRDAEDVDTQLVLARVLMSQKKYADAAALLGKLEKAHPDELTVAAAWVDLHVQQEDSEGAIRACGKIVDMAGEKPVGYLIRARTCQALGRMDDAEADLVRAGQLAPKDVGVWVRQHDFYRDAGRRDDAVKAIRHALKLVPDDLDVIKRATATQLSSDDPEQTAAGESLLASSLVTYPGDVDLRFQKATLLLKQPNVADRQEGLSLLKAIVADEPRAARAWLNLVQISYQRGNYRQAMDLAFEALAHAPRHRELLMVKAQAETALAPVLAIPTLKTLREFYPEDVGAVLLLANAYGEVGEGEKAVALLEETLASADEADQASLKLALVAASYRGGSKAQAVAQLDELQQAEPDNPQVLVAQVDLLGREKAWDRVSEKVAGWQRRHAEDAATLVAVADILLVKQEQEAHRIAAETLQKVLKLEPAHGKALLNLAILLQTFGRIDEAIDLYEQHLDSNPDNVVAINNLAWLLCEERQDFVHALELAEKGLTLAPEYLDLVDTRGVVFYRLGQLNRAIRDFEKCVEGYPDASPGLAGSYFHLGRSLIKLGDVSKAAQHLQRAEELNARTGGLTASDLAEMQRLMGELSKGS